MRKVASEVGVRETEGHDRPGLRSAAIRKALRKSRLRAMALEGLESRTLLAVLPPISVSGQVDISNGGGSAASGLVNNAPAGNATNPSVAIDPTAPQDMVAVWVTDSANFTLNSGQTNIFVEMSYSTNGGKSWSPETTASLGNSQVDINQAQNNGTRWFTQVTDPTVAFDAQHNFYVLDSPHAADYSSGEVVLSKFQFTSGAPQAENIGTTSSNLAVLYQWAGQDAVYRPTMAVDNLPSNASALTGGYNTNDPYTNNIYVAWATNETLQPNTNQQDPNQIQLIASSDGGADFSTPVYVNNDGFSTPSRSAAPQIVISQGRPADTTAYGGADLGVTPGQVTIIWDDTNILVPQGKALDQIFSSRVQTGGGGATYNDTGDIGKLIGDAGPPPSGSPINSPTTTEFDLTVPNGAPANPTDLSVNIALQHNNLAELLIQLEGPDGTIYTLVNNKLDDNNNDQANPNIGISGTNLGQSVSGQWTGTTFNDGAADVITNNAGGAASVGTYRGEGGNGGAASLKALLAQVLLNNKTVAGTWKLLVTDFRFDNGPKPAPALEGYSITFNAGLKIDAATQNTPVATTAVRGALNAGVYPLTGGVPNSAVPDVGIGPGAVIGSDNTLGPNSPHEGRLYVAYTNKVVGQNIVNATDNTDIALVYSDDGGASWHTLTTKVNDDNATTDGYTESGSTTGGKTTTISGRAQFQPAIAVDPATGTLVIAFRDARDDASRDRVATYVATSIDGGNSFGPETYVNPQQTATDFISGQTDVLGPVPDNQSTGNPQRDTKFDFGDRMGLAVLDGHVYPVWSGNENGGQKGTSLLNILTANAVIAAGPRIVSSSMGPVQINPNNAATVYNVANGTTSSVPYNNQTMADGTPILNGFEVTFDRPINATTFTTSDVSITFEDPFGNTKPITATAVQPVYVATDPNQNGHFGFETFLISFPNQSSVGTYSYTISPTNSPIKDGIIAANLQNSTPQQTVTVTNSTNTPIPTSGTGGSGNPNNDVSTSTITFTPANIPAADTVGNVTVTLNDLNMSVGSLGALKIELLTSHNDDIILYSNPGDPNKQFFNTTFSDSGTAIGGTYANAIFRPASGQLASLIGELADQTYTLKITDQQSGNVGTLIGGWSLHITPVQPGAGAQIGATMDQNANAITGQASDSYSIPAPATTTSLLSPSPTGSFSPDSLPLIIPGPQMIGSTVPGASSTSPALALNTTANALDVQFNRDMLVSTFTPADILRIMGPAGEVSAAQTFSSQGSPQVIADNPAQPLTATLTVPSFGGMFPIANLAVNLNITETQDSDLTVVLIAPDGTAVTLIQSGGPNGQNFVGTTLSDQGLTSISQGTAPFSGTFKPVQALATLNGKQVEGTWKLQITDNKTNGSIGTLNSWALIATPAATVTPSFNAPVPDSGIVIGPGSSVPIPLTINNDGPFLIQNLRARLDISDQNVGGLTATLSNGSRTITLFSNVGAGGVDFTNTTFDDNALTSITQTLAPFTGVFRPVQQLSSFIGQQLNGTWTLTITNTGTTSATLNSWSLEAAPSNSNAVARQFRVDFPTQQLSGTYTVQIASSVTDDNGNALDMNQNAGLAVLRGFDPNGVLTPKTYNSADTPQPIQVQPPNGTTPVNVTQSVINIPDSFPIQGITLTLNATYANDPDLIISLVPPPSTGISPITLFSGANAKVAGANFANTIFDDNGSTLIDNGGPPYASQQKVNHYRPEQALDQVLNQSSQGQWTLVIQDTGSSTAPGQLNNWSLTLTQNQPSSGLGETVADQAMGTFRIFTMDPTNRLASDTWTAVGPASIGGGGGAGPEGGGSGGRSGRIGGLAVDPSDPSGNTVYIGGASGGVWKTTDFLNPNGPTYIPLTDFGPTSGLNIGGIAVFGRNNDPNQSIVFAATGEGDTGSTGVGVLRSMDGGATWTLLDSTDNTLPFAQRDHIFAKGTSAYKIVVDPTPSASGDVSVYMALSGAQGGIWRSVDSGVHWTQMLAGQATDVALAPYSGNGVPGPGGEPTGNLQIVYAAMRGQGVFLSPNRGQNWNLMAGNIGNPLIIDQDTGKNVNPSDLGSEKTPNASAGSVPGRIELAVPALTGNPQQDALYEGWVYAGVITPDSHFQGLYLTKDFGQNWTQVRIPTMPPVALTVGLTPQAIPTNDPNQRDYDVGGGPAGTGLPAQGNYDFSLGIDPTNPNVVYMGGTADGQPTGFIRIDATDLSDAHALVPLSGSVNDGGTLQVPGNDGRAIAGDPTKASNSGGILNFIPSPANGTQTVTNLTAFSDTGVGATWIPFDMGGTDQHRIFTTVDPLTHHARIIIGDDQGVFTTVDNHGTFDAGIGSASNGVADSTIGDRNGNLQITQFYYGALQPSNVAAMAAGALFYASAQDNGGPQSAPDLLTTGNISWGGPGGDAGGVATDQTGSGTFYQYWWPCCGGGDTNFFQVNGAPKTNGLLQVSGGLPTPDPQWPQTGGQTFAVNPINSNQVIMGSAAGRLFKTETATTPTGTFWFPIAEPTTFDGSQITAPAYGAPDPKGPFGVGNLDEFLYAGTANGNIYVSQTGGGGGPGGGNAWININNGALTNPQGSVNAIVTNPSRGSHEAYAVTSGGVFYNSNTVGPNASQWVNITGNLFQLMHNIFGDSALADTIARGLTSMVADWRYLIPDANGNTHPILYVGGNGGVFRSLDNGKTWSVFPNVAFDGSPADGGYLPLASVTDLGIADGNVDPATGRAVAAPGDPDLLMATTYGRGVFAIRLAPTVFANTNAPGTPLNMLHLDSTDSPPSDTGVSNTDEITSNPSPYVVGLSEQSAFGNTVTVNLYDQTRDPHHFHPIGTGTTDPTGHFRVQINPGTYKTDGSADGVHVIAVQATDQAGTEGNVATFSFTLLTQPPGPPAGPTLESGSDTGISNSDQLTKDNNGSGGPAPLFDVNLNEPNTAATLERAPLTFTAQTSGALIPAFGTATIPLTVPQSALSSPAATINALTLDLSGLSLGVPTLGLNPATASKLTVTLTGPDGTTVTVPQPYGQGISLAGLNGKAAAGTYLLTVSNVGGGAALLAGYRLTLTDSGNTTRTVSSADTAGSGAIARVSPVISSTINVPYSSLAGPYDTISGLSLDLSKLNVTPSSGLEVTLALPDGTVIPITGPFTANMPVPVPAGKLAVGTYTVSITNAGSTAGTFSGWNMSLTESGSPTPLALSATTGTLPVLASSPSLVSTLTIPPASLGNPNATIPGLVLDLSKLVVANPADLSITLTGPDGTTIPVSAPYTGAIALNGLNGKLAAGTYTLAITDTDVSGKNLASLGGWSLELAGVNSVSGGTAINPTTTYTGTVTIGAGSLPSAGFPASLIAEPSGGTISSVINVPAGSLTSPSANIASLTLDLSRLSSQDMKNVSLSLTLPGGQFIPIPQPYGSSVSVTLPNNPGAAAGNYILSVTNSSTTSATELSGWSLTLKDNGNGAVAKTYPPSAILDGAVLDLSQLTSTQAINATITLTGPDGTIVTVPAPTGPTVNIPANGSVSSQITVPGSALSSPSALIAALQLDLPQLNFPAGSLSNLTITLTDPAGNKVTVPQPYGSGINLSGLTGDAAAGTYTLTITNSGPATGTLAGWNLVVSDNGGQSGQFPGYGRYVDLSGLTGKLAAGTYKLSIVNNGTAPLNVGNWSVSLPGTLTTMTAVNIQPGPTTGTPPLALTGIADTNAGMGQIPDGVYVYSAIESDLAGNNSLIGPGNVVTIDATGPALVAPSLTAATDTGLPVAPRDQDNITNNPTPDFQGYAEPGASVALFVNGVAAGTAVADPVTGLYKITATVSLTEGLNYITVQETDAAGNAGPISAARVVRLDTTPPPSIQPKLAPSSDTGRSNSDGVTFNTTPTFTGTGELPQYATPFVSPEYAGALIELFAQVTSTQNPNPNPVQLVGEALADPVTGAYSVTVGHYINPQPAGAITALADGTYTISAVQVDVAGNASRPILFGNTGAVVIDGTDSALHGDNNGPGGTNEQSWLYVQDVVNAIQPNITSPDRTLVFLGAKTDPTGTGLTLDFTQSVFAQSVLPGKGWNAVYLNGAANINAFFSDQPTTVTDAKGNVISSTFTINQTGFLFMVTANKLGDDINESELAALDLHGADIRNFVNTGAGFYAEHEEDFSNKQVPFGWLTSIFPGLQAVQSGGGTNGLVVTPAGQAIFPTLTAADFSSAIWHNYFTGNFANQGLAVAVTVPDFSAGQVPLVLASNGGIGGNSSAQITIDTDGPDPKPSPPPVLEAGSDTSGGLDITRDNNSSAQQPAPIFDVANVESEAQVQLFRTPINPTTHLPIGPMVLVNTVINGSASAATVQIADVNQPNGTSTSGGPIPDGTYLYTEQQTDLAGVTDTMSAGTQVTILTVPPPPPAAFRLDPSYDTGRFNNDGVTRDNNGTYPAPLFDLNGVAANSTVELFRNGTLVAEETNVSPANGQFSIFDFNNPAPNAATPGPVIPDGTYTYYALQLDQAGNVSKQSPTITVTIDSDGPDPKPVAAPVLEPASDTSGGLSITRNNNSSAQQPAPIFDVANVEPAAQVQLFRAPIDSKGNVGTAVLVDTIYNNGATTTTVKIADVNQPNGTSASGGPIPDGTYVYFDIITDLAGVSDTPNTTTKLTVDTITPVAPSPFRLDPGSDTGRSNSDGITRVTLTQSPVFDVGSIVAGATAELFRTPVDPTTHAPTGPTTQVATKTYATGGSQTIADVSTPIPDGTYAYYALQIDQAGNVGVQTSTIYVTYVTAAQPVTGQPVLDPASDTGVKGDNITSDTSPTFDISNVQPNDTLELVRDGNVVATITNVGAVGGTVQITDTGPVSFGPHKYQALQIDVAGNPSPLSASVTITFQTDPTGALSLDPASDSGTKGDNITDVTSNLLIDVSGVTAGATVNLLRGGVIVATLPNAPGGTVAIADPGPLSSGQYTYTAQQVINGNVSPSGPSLTITIDTSIPAAPGQPVLDPLSDSGVKGDNLTNVTTPTIDVPGIAPGATVELFRNGALVASLTSVAGGQVAITDSPGVGMLTQPTTFTYTVKQVSAAGNASPSSLSLKVTIDTTIPATPTISLDPADQTSLGATTTNVPNPLIDVAGVVPGATVNLYRNNVLVNQATVPTANTTGKFTISDPGPVASGTYIYTVLQTSVAGNSSQYSSGLSVTVNLGANNGLTTPTLALSPIADSGIAGDNVTSIRYLTFSGTANPPGVTVSIYNAATNALVATATSNAQGNFTATSTTTLLDGVYNFIAKSSNGSGVSQPSTALTVSIVSVPGDYSGAGVSDPTVARRVNAGLLQWFVQNVEIASFGAGGLDVPLSGDFNGDGKTDLAVYRPSTAQWFILESTPTQPGVFVMASFGAPNLDIPVVANYFGDGRSDIAVYRPTTGQWFIGGLAQPISFGGPGDTPVPGHYAPAYSPLTIPANGTLTTTITVPTSVAANPLSPISSLMLDLSSLNFPAASLGNLTITLTSPDGTVVPLSAPYNNSVPANQLDGKPAPGVYTLTIKNAGSQTGTFGGWSASFNIANNTSTRTYVSQTSPVATAPGADEEAVYRPSNGTWYILGPNGGYGVSFGGPSDIPVPGNYDDTATYHYTEEAVFRPSTGQYFILGPNGIPRVIQFAPGDIPAPGDYDGVGYMEPAVYRPSTSQWLVEGPNDASPRVFATFGGPSDIPVAAPSPYRSLVYGAQSLNMGAQAAAMSVALSPSSASSSATPPPITPSSVTVPPQTAALTTTPVTRQRPTQGSGTPQSIKVQHQHQHQHSSPRVRLHTLVLSALSRRLGGGRHGDGAPSA